MVGGTPDIIAVHPDENSENIRRQDRPGVGVAHRSGAALHVPAAEGSRSKRWRDKKFEGVVMYADGSERRISADSVDDAFVSRVAEFMRKMTSDMPPRRVPSLAECGWCELTSADCPDRIEPDEDTDAA